MSSSAFGRSPAPKDNSSTPRGGSTRWRPRSPTTPPTSPTCSGRFEAHRHSLELGFATVFVMLALTMLFSAIWLGLAFANRLVGPIRRLIRATDEVASGNLHVQVPTRASDGDLGHLGDTFNKMTSELLRQQTGLIEANALNDERRALHRGGAFGRARRRARRRQRRRDHHFERRRRAAPRRRARPDRAGR